MGKFDGVLLVSDFDGTLYGSRHEIGERNIQALRYFMEQGGQFTVATGRVRRIFRDYVREVPMNAPIILANGAALYDFGRDEMLEQTFLPEESVEMFKAVCEQFPELGFETYHGEEIYAYRPNAVTEGHMKKVGGSYIEVKRIEDIPLPWEKVLFQQENELLIQVQEWLSEHFSSEYEVIFSTPVYLEITCKGISKGGMVKRLAQRLGIEKKNLYCVGDNQNDIPMLECSAIPFAPGDCAQVVKDFGVRLLCPCDEGVMGDILKILDEIYQEQ